MIREIRNSHQRNSDALLAAKFNRGTQSGLFLPSDADNNEAVQFFQKTKQNINNSSAKVIDKEYNETEKE